MHHNYYLGSQAEIENAEDALVIDVKPPLGQAEVSRRLKSRIVIQQQLSTVWPLKHQVDFVHAYTLLFRTAAMAALIDSHNPSDLAFAIGVPEWSIRVALVTLEASNWRDYLLPLLNGAMQLYETAKEITDILDEFIEDGLEGDISWVDLLKATGPCMRLPDGYFHTSESRREGI